MTSSNENFVYPTNISFQFSLCSHVLVCMLDVYSFRIQMHKGKSYCMHMKNNIGKFVLKSEDEFKKNNNNNVNILNMI